MQWFSQTRGNTIEEWIDQMCTEFPTVMLDVLKTGIGPLWEWYDDGTWETAQCGCLIGTCAVAAREDIACMVPTMQQTLPRIEPSFRFGIVSNASYALYVAMKCARGETPLPFGRYFEDHEPLYSTIATVGMFASDEVPTGNRHVVDYDPDERNAEVVNYLHERIATNLALTGFASLTTLRRLVNTQLMAGAMK